MVWLVAGVAVAAGGMVIARGAAGRSTHVTSVRLAAKVSPAPVPRGALTPGPQTCFVADGNCSLTPCVVFVASTGDAITINRSPGRLVPAIPPNPQCNAPFRRMAVGSVPLRSTATARAEKSGRG